ncbi:MAG: PolC-type DNA polymerase III [Lachnospiraceae bacterium]|nr:PolC-type DNA polymerase III [Lachnospiraceae bacterium]
MKSLFETLPNLDIPANLRACLSDAMVDRVVMSADRQKVRIELICRQLVSRRQINALSGHIKRQFFARDEIKVQVAEHFDLPDITAAGLMDQYGESIAEELKENSLIFYTFFEGSEVKTSGTTLELINDNNAMNANTAPLVLDYLRKIVNERLGTKVDVKITLAGERRESPAAASDTPAISGGDKPVFRRKPKGTKLVASQGFGYDFSGASVSISDITDGIGEVITKGQVVVVDERTLKTGNLLFVATITDFHDSIRVKVFAKPEEAEVLKGVLKAGNSVILKGDAVYDSYDHEVVIQQVKGIKFTDRVRYGLSDDCDEKRVELHCHTKMSDMDGVSYVGDIIEKAANFGHKAIAVTDHGVVYAFPDAMNAAKKMAKKGKPIKIIYGCEGYLVEDRDCRSVEDVMQQRMYHIILLAKNDIGRINLYRLVSESHLTYYHRRPRIPRSLLMECREGLIIGSACEAGELIRAIVEKEPEEEIIRRASFYDYLEVQPIGNNAFMVREGRFGIKTDDDLRAINNKVIELGEQLGKPVVATSDVHFLNPEDEIYRRIIMAGMGYEDADYQPPLYLHTTQEMLDEFAYLGREKAHEIVIDNTNLIADMCEDILPVRLDKCPPVIEGSQENLKKICYERAHDMYGDPLPAIVQERLDKELNSIIGNGYSVMYVFAQMLVKDSVDHGYLVGSRGSVGSSLAATMSDITEVNPLPPHYRCGKCRYSEFDSEEIRSCAGLTGYDLPDKVCPVCGAPLIKEGIDIPFETFLGFKGDKEPDIDLNFSGEYQSKAHAYTAELFGDGYTFRAGTISGLADKTAYGFVKKYFESRNEIRRNCEIDRLTLGCMDVRRSTGQHPGGIVVMPRGENIYSFTPIQHPANDMKTDIVTTHFDYHKIEQNLLKFDILGHEDPTMMHRLQELTGIKPTSIAIDDPKLYSLFKDTSALGITPEDMGGTPLGTLGIPEFNTDFAMQMLIEAKPDGFADLVNIAGLAHGTAVWMDNARDLILSGTATLRSAICTRDGIMLALIGYGMDPAESFAIMEAVRKGKVAKHVEGRWEDWKKDMKEHGVPDWYIGSCEKIEYMFPKAHAAAYVMMALRVAYFKIYHPLEFYAAYFGIRADGFSYEKMCMGFDRLMENIEFYKKNLDKLTKLEKDTYNKAMRVAHEMYARGYEFMPIDIYRAHPTKFQVIDGRIMPSLTSITGLGEKAAEQLSAEAARAKFLSKEDLISRSHISSTIADVMEDMGLLGGIPKTNQISLFDMMLE